MKIKKNTTDSGEVAYTIKGVSHDTLCMLLHLLEDLKTGRCKLTYDSADFSGESFSMTDEAKKLTHDFLDSASRVVKDNELYSYEHFFTEDMSLDTVATRNALLSLSLKAAAISETLENLSESVRGA